MMRQTYEAEQEQLEQEAAQLQQEIEVQERQNEKIGQFIRKVHKYEGLTGLTPRSLRDLVSGIYVSAPDKPKDRHRQNIHISMMALDLSLWKN